MRTIALFSALALGALTSAALAAPAAVTTTPTATAASQQVGRVELNDTQLDKLKAGYAYNDHSVFNNSGHQNCGSYSGHSESYHYVNC